jgi:hypothetical protein
MKPKDPPYFIRWLDDRDSHAPSGAKFEVQILNEIGEGELIAYFTASSKLISLVHALRGTLPINDVKIPEKVIRAAHQLVGRSGEYVNENGDVMNPGFYSPA